MTYETFLDDVKSERPLSEGDQIKAAIRTMFVTSRKTGRFFTEDDPLKVTVRGVNGTAGEAMLNLARHPTRRGAVVMWYGD